MNQTNSHTKSYTRHSQATNAYEAQQHTQSSIVNTTKEKKDSRIEPNLSLDFM